MSNDPKTETLPRVRLTCTTTGSLRIETAKSIMMVSRDPRYEVDVHFMNDRPYTSALNIAARSAIADEFDWWLHIDNDQYWTKNPLDAIDHGKSLVGFPAPVYRPGDGAPGGLVMCYMAYNITDPGDETRPPQVAPAESDGKLQRVDIISSGAMLIRVEALKVCKAYESDLFSRRFDEDGVAIRGTDLEFCRRWRECGLHVWADFGSPSGHFGTVDLLELIGDMAKIQGRRKEDASETNGKAEDGRIVRPGIS